MVLSENHQIISHQTTAVDTMNKHFVNITCKLKLEPMESKLHCQKYSIGTETTKALLKSDLR